MDLIIADFVTSVTTDGTDTLRFSMPELPISLRPVPRALTEDEMMRHPLISRMIIACKSRASMELFCSTDPSVILKVVCKILLGSTDLYEIIKCEAGVKVSILLKYETEWDKADGYRNLAMIEGNSRCNGFNLFLGKSYKFPLTFNIQVKIIVHFPESLLTLPEVHHPSRKILEDGTLSNITLVASNGAEIKGHRSFLAVASPVLAAMFETEMKESKTGRVDMTDMSEQGIWAFLRFLYYGDLNGLKEDADVAFQVLYAAQKYLVGGLDEDALKILLMKEKEHFSAEVAFKIYMFVRNLESELAAQLKTKVIQILIGKLGELRMLESYRTLFEDSSNSETAMEVFEDFAKMRPLP